MMRDNNECNVASHQRPHEQLEVYRLAHELGLRVHTMSLKLPKHEMYEEGSQVRRASKSVSAQIVEGHALRQYKAEYEHYLARSYASAEEVIEHLKYILSTGSAKSVKAECDDLRAEYGTLCRKLYNYQQSVHRQHDPSRSRIKI
jgi:four helix bundle protein